MSNDVPYLELDMVALQKLEYDLNEMIEFIEDELPDINWDSKLETAAFFKEEFLINVDNNRIQFLQALLGISESNQNQALVEILAGLIELKKLKAKRRNYVWNFFKHVDMDRKYHLRNVNGEWRMQNKQSLPYSQDILDCIIWDSRKVQ